MFENKEGLIDLESIGRKHLRRIRRNLPTSLLVEEVVKNREGQIAHLGSVVVRTGDHKERSPDDRFIVREPTCEERVWWNGKNKPMEVDYFHTLFFRLLAYMQNKDVYIQDCHVGADRDLQLSIRIATETAWHSLYARNMFLQIHDLDALERFKPDFTVVHVPGFQAIPDLDGTRSSSFVIANMAQKVVFIGGTSYAGEIKHAVYNIADALMPTDQVLPVRCSVNLDADGNAAMFIGRSGAGKTALATDPERILVGDDQHGWTAKGMFNYEWGCYARGLNLSPEVEPLIHECTRKFGTILENVSIDPDSRRLDLTDAALTENTRAAYPITHIPGSRREGVCGHPRDLFVLTCDPYGVLPPIARLTPEQAIFALLSSYTPELAEADDEIRKDRVLHSACFGACPLIMTPVSYAKRFMGKIVQHKVRCWLMNTGWSGEPRGRGKRVPLAISRALVHAAAGGQLDQVEYSVDPIFQLEIPTSCPGVDAGLLDPRGVAEEEGEYEVRANRLATDFMRDFDHFKDQMPESIHEMLSKIVLLEDTLDVMEQFRFTI